MNIFDIFASKNSAKNEVRQQIQANPRQGIRQKSDSTGFAPFMAHASNTTSSQVPKSGTGVLNMQNILSSATSLPTSMNALKNSPMSSPINSSESLFGPQNVKNQTSAQQIGEEQGSAMQSAVSFANGSLVTRSIGALRGVIAGSAGMSEARARTSGEEQEAPKTQQSASSKMNNANNANNANNTPPAVSPTVAHFAPTREERGLLSNGISLTSNDTHTLSGISLRGKTGRSLSQKSMPFTGTQAIALDATSLKRLDRIATKRQEASVSGQNTDNGASHASQAKELGHLAARFESGTTGIETIGYDRNGGTSYGTYQIASRPGSMERFINYLEKQAPDMAKSLTEAGPANTGSRKGGMPEAWRALAKEDPARLESLQKQFIHDTHYQPALKAVEKAGFVVEDFSNAMKEVLWSTSVQHGPNGAARIFTEAAAAVGLQPAQQKSQEPEIIESIYTLRAGRFESSSEGVQNAVRSRMESEKHIALASLSMRETRLTA